MKPGDLIETSYEGFKQPWMLDAIKKFKKPWKIVKLRTNSVEFIDGAGATHTWLYERVQVISEMSLENE